MTEGRPRALLSAEIAGEAEAAGLLRPWELVAARPPGPGTGRGPRAVVALPSGLRVLVKQYLRGGLVARVNRERYFATGRFAREMEAGARARADGVPVGETLGVVLVPARPGCRAWGIARYIEDAPDLVRWLGPGGAAAERDVLWCAVLRAVERAHDAGIEHADLNLGNLLARRTGANFEVFLVDLDRAVLHVGPVPAPVRARVLARLARSHRKLFGHNPPR